MGSNIKRHDLSEMKNKGVLAYLKESPLLENACITCKQYTGLKRGEAFALLEQIPRDQRARVRKLDLEYAGLGGYEEREDLSPIKKLFPNMKKISLGFGINPEELGQLAELFPDLSYLKLRNLHACISENGDDHLKQLIKAAQKGALRNLTTLKLAQNMFSPILLNNFFAALPKLIKLAFIGMEMEPYVQTLIPSMLTGALSKIEKFQIHGRNLKNKYYNDLLQAVPETCNFALFNNTFNKEGFDIFQKAIEKGALKQLSHLDLSNNLGIPPVQLAKTLASMPRLTTVNLENMGLTNDHMIALEEEAKSGRFKNVTNLILSNNKDISIKAVAALAAGLPNLTSLSMRGMKLTGASVKALIGIGKDIEYLDLCGSELSTEALMILIEGKLALKGLNLSGTNLTSEHLYVLINSINKGWLKNLNGLDLGGKQLFTGPALQHLAEALPSCLSSLSFSYGVLVKEHFEGLYEAARKGALSGITNFYIGISSIIRQTVNENSGLLIGLLCQLPKLQYLDLYCVATDSLLQNIIVTRTGGKLQELKSINIMECRGILPSTLYMLHIAFPEQGLSYFEMEFDDRHSRALAKATKESINGIYPLRNVTLFNAINNPFSAKGLANLLAIVPNIVQLYLNGQDISTEKLNAIAKLHTYGKLLKVACINMDCRNARHFDSESLVNLVCAFKNLTSFCLHRSQITNKDIRLLAKAAKTKEGLQNVTDLSLLEEWGPEKVFESQISEAVEKNGELEILPRNIEPESRVSPTALAQLIENLPLLTGLQLSVWVTNKHIEALLSLAVQGKLCKLTGLDLSHNPMITDPKLLLAFIAALFKTAPKFDRLTLRNIGLSTEAWTFFLDGLRAIPLSIPASDQEKFFDNIH